MQLHAPAALQYDRYILGLEIGGVNYLTRDQYSSVSAGSPDLWRD